MIDLLKEGAPVDVTWTWGDKNQYTDDLLKPFIFQMTWGQQKGPDCSAVIEALFNAGLKAKPEHLSGLQPFIRNDQKVLLKCLLQKGIDINCEAPVQGGNILHCAFTFADKDLALAILDVDSVDVNRTNKNGETVLDITYRNGPWERETEKLEIYKEMRELLLSHPNGKEAVSLNQPEYESSEELSGEKSPKKTKCYNCDGKGYTHRLNKGTSGSHKRTCDKCKGAGFRTF